MDCIFCKISQGIIPSYTLYEDDIVKVFLDVNPNHNGHTLIVSKKHYQDFFDIDDETLIIPKEHFLGLQEIDDNVLMHIMKSARKMEELLKGKLNIDGLTLVQNNGDIQEVKHFHLHLKPYYKNKQEIIKVEDIYNKLKES